MRIIRSELQGIGSALQPPGRRIRALPADSAEARSEMAMIAFRKAAFPIWMGEAPFDLAVTPIWMAEAALAKGARPSNWR